MGTWARYVTSGLELGPGTIYDYRGVPEPNAFARWSQAPCMWFWVRTWGPVDIWLSRCPWAQGMICNGVLYLHKYGCVRAYIVILTEGTCVYIFGMFTLIMNWVKSLIHGVLVGNFLVWSICVKHTFWSHIVFTWLVGDYESCCAHMCHYHMWYSIACGN